MAGWQVQESTTKTSKQVKQDFVPGEILVRFREDAQPLKNGNISSIKTIHARQLSLQVEQLAPHEIVPGLCLVRVSPEDTLQAIESLRLRPDVLYAEPNYIRRIDAVPNDPRYGEMWALKNTGQSSGSVGADIMAEQAWDTTSGNRSVVVGVVDEGMDISHPDLRDNIWQNTAEIPSNGVDDDGNGFVDDINGWDFFHNDKTVFDGNGTYPADETDAHGTHVAGTIGASGNNGVGVVGVNWQVSLMSLKILGSSNETQVPSSTRLTVQAYSYAKMMRDLWISSDGR
jgi:subtilisin family serine protease